MQMAAYFFDSSALAKRFIRETGTAFVLSLWRPSAHHAIYAARLTEVEVCAALARRHKGLKLAADQFHKSVKRLRRDFTERLAVTATTESIVIEALRLAESYALRGYDALQLASALEANRRRGLHHLSPLTFVSSDEDLNKAAQAEGLTVEDPNTH
ncbi:MAG: type II toxin-antitoxin system VapC family toxin [Acidobacteriota bacterium]